MHRVLLLAHNPSHLDGLAAILQLMPGCKLIVLSQWNWQDIRAALSDLMVVCCDEDKASVCIPKLCNLHPWTKLLALAPFGSALSERCLIGMGADDVLRLPVTRARLEVSMYNLLRLASLEKQMQVRA